MMMLSSANFGRGHDFSHTIAFSLPTINVFGLVQSTTIDAVIEEDMEPGEEEYRAVRGTGVSW